MSEDCSTGNGADTLALLRDKSSRSRNTLNMIASENRISPAARECLALDAASRYYFEGTDPPAFPGGHRYKPVQLTAEDTLRRLGHAEHVNLRPLSGLHAMTVLIAAFTQPGDSIVSLAPSAGGHYATAPLSERLGRKNHFFGESSPHRLDEENLCSVLETARPALLYVDQCHGLVPIDIARIVEVSRSVSPSTLIHSDVSHGLGLVLGGVLDNPLVAGCDSFGGSTHKTFPGPQKGMLATNSQELADRIAEAQFHLISNHHLNTSVCLAVALWEFENHGGLEYAKRVPVIANEFGQELAQRGIPPVKPGKRFSEWHQLWIAAESLPCDPREAARRLASAQIMVNVLNDLPDLQPFALRLGVSEITHLGFGSDEVVELAELFVEAVHLRREPTEIATRISRLVQDAPRPYDFRGATTPSPEIPTKSPQRDDLHPEELTPPEDLNAKASRHLWRPWSQANLAHDLPVFVEGCGCWIVDREGNSYLDAISGALNANLGYGSPHVPRAAYEQMRRLMNCNAMGGLNEPTVLLAEKISALTGHALPRTMFCNSGSEAAEAALKMAFCYQAFRGRPERQKIVGVSQGYHGCTVGALSLGQIDFTRAGLDWLPSFSLSIPTPSESNAGLESFEKLLGGPSGQSIAALILEPVLGIGGIHPIPRTFLEGARRLCDHHDILLIVDEVLTGFGRTGRMFGYQHAAITPDIMMTSKGLTAGYLPLSAISATEAVFEASKLDPYLGGLRHGHTMSGNASVCASALATLDIVERDGLVSNAEEMGVLLLSRLCRHGDHPRVKEVRGRGLLVGIEMNDPEVAQKVVENAFQAGLLIREQAGVVQLIPPLVVSEEEVLLICDRFSEALDATG